MTTRPTTEQIAAARTAAQGLAQHVIDVMDDQAVTDVAQADLGLIEQVLAWAERCSLTLAEIQALPVGAVVQDRDGDTYTRVEPDVHDSPACVWVNAGDADEITLRAEWLLDYAPVTLVSTP